MSSLSLYCRFCAEEKFVSEFTDETKQNSVIEKLSIFENKFVDLSMENLPKTVCIACYEIINISVKFFLRVQRAQLVLEGIFEVKDISDYIDTPDGEPFCKAEDPPIEYELKNECDDDIEDGELFCKAKDPPIEYELKTECDDVIEDITIIENLLPSNFKLPQLEGFINSWSDYPMICKFCKVKVSDQDILGNHCVEVHRKCFGISCVDCDVEVESFEEFLKHVGIHRPNLRKICPYCNKVINQLSDHIKLEHTANKHPCILCGNIYQYKQNLRAHEAITDHTPLTTPPKKFRRTAIPPTLEDLTCHICAAIMKTTASLKSHLTLHGDKKRNHTCDRCGKTYLRKGNLVQHRLIHEVIDRPVCKICSKSFLTLGRLRRHIKTHNFVLPFQCDVCNRCFSSKDRIREHVKVHMNIMPFKCKFCPKKFRFSSLIKSHENQHTGARPFKCEFCSMDFANWSNCNKHMKRKHNMTLAKHVMTRYGKLAVDPETGKPNELNMDNNGIKEWTENVLMKKKPKRATIQKK